MSHNKLSSKSALSGVVMEVRVEPPRIQGDTVTFSWSQTEGNPYQEENAFFFRYEGLDLQSFSTELFYEIFLALQLRVFSAYDCSVEIHFPTPVPAFGAAFWTAYHDATNISIHPISNQGAYNPWSSEPILVDQPKKSAVFFGGGKDSILATCLLAEIQGQNEVVLIQFVGPLRNDPQQTAALEARQHRLLLEPARRVLGVATQRGWTDYQANFREAGFPFRPHLEFYCAGALPAMLAWGVDYCTFTANWTIMSTDVRNTGARVHRYMQSRPNTIVAQSRHYEATLGRRLEVGNILLPFHALAAHWMLAERYPEVYDQIVSCTLGGPNKRWCLTCKKCGLFAFSSLAIGRLAADFDYDTFLTNSSFINKALAHAQSGVEPNHLGNVTWIPSFFTGIRSFILGCHMIARIEIDELPITLSEPAMANLAMLQAMYGNHRYPDYETVPRMMVELLGPELGPQVSAIVAEHFEIVDFLPGPNYAGNRPTEYHFDVPLPAAIAALDHLRFDSAG